MGTNNDHFQTFGAEFLMMMQAQNSELQQASSFFRNRPGTVKVSADL